VLLPAFRVSGALLASVGAGASPCRADALIKGCTIVSNPTREHYTTCRYADLNYAGLRSAVLCHTILFDDTFNNRAAEGVMAHRPLEGKVAVVTGASRGVGRAVASTLAGLGASVVVTARTVVPQDDLPGTIGHAVRDIETAGGSAVAIAADLTDPADVDRLATETLQAFGRVDILVNNLRSMTNCRPSGRRASRPGATRSSSMCMRHGC
jgi:hypothetical protein